MNYNEMINILTNNYNIKFTNIELLRKGGCISYCVWSDDVKYFLKIIPTPFMDTAKQSLDILLYLQEKGFPSPYIITTKEGTSYIENIDLEGSNLWVLFEFIEGREPDVGEDIETIGSLVGQLHTVMNDYNKELPVHDKEFFIDRYIHILKKIHYNENKIEMFREYGDYLWKCVENIPLGFCHGDLHRGNLLKTISGKYYLLDFDTSCKAFSMYDIMVLCNSTNYFNFDENGYEKTKYTYEAFLKGYLKYRKLSKIEINSLYNLIAIYHYQLQATIIEIYGLDCVDEAFFDRQLDWLMRWSEQCKNKSLPSV